MGEASPLDGTNIFLIIVILIIVVSIAAGLLLFICSQFLPEIDTDRFNPKTCFKRRQVKRPNSPSVALPSKIVVTRPASDVGSLGSEIDSRIDVQEYSDPEPTPRPKTIHVQNGQEQSESAKEEQERKPRRKLPRQKVIYSCEVSPISSPKQKNFIWSRNNSYDLTDKENDSGKSIRGTNSPLGVYHHFAARRNSAPLKLKPTKSMFF